ncbi:DUF4214 domain-containing protein [Pseudoduganella sp.]|uniref:DUF4214 domain-containing protein n=1 Tax=Pseudoduganella sp. TaxID=1880898 RepID=UPI0035B0525B
MNVTGTAGKDVLSGGNEADRIRGGAGDDKLEGGAGQDELYGEEGDDVLTEGDDGNVLDGGDGDDLLDARGANQLLGGAGNDTLYLTIGRGSATLDGGDGNDYIDIKSSPYGKEVWSVRASGGSGRDVFDIAGPEALRRGLDLVITDFQAGAGGDVLGLRVLYEIGWRPAQGNPMAPGGWLALVQEGADTLLVMRGQVVTRLLNVAVGDLTIENFQGDVNPDGSENGYTLHGSAGADALWGGALRDVLNGAGGADTLRGLEGDDLLDGGTQAEDDGADVLEGGGGADLLRGGAGNDRLVGGNGNDTLEGGDGDDELSDDAGVNILRGGAGNDRLEDSGRAGSQLEGGAGNDFLSGNGSGRYSGGDGNDTVVCQNYGPRQTAPVVDLGSGYDTLSFGNSGVYSNDVRATGGAGRDTYDLAKLLPGTLTVTDFSAGSGGDVLLVRGIPKLQSLLENPFGKPGYLRLAQQEHATVIEYDPDGAAGIEFGYRPLVILENVKAGDLVASNFSVGIDPHGDKVGLYRLARPQGETLHGTAWNDELRGHSGADALYGGAGDDILAGSGGDDQLYGGAGYDMLDGGAGRDHAWFGAGRAAYALEQSEGMLRVTALDGASTTELRHVERLHFGASALALDVDGVAGQVFRLYQAAFDRKPDLEGVGYWMAAAEKGFSLFDIAAGFINSDEFRKLYGSNPANGELVDRFYQNVLHRAPDAEGRAYWLNVLDQKLAPLSSVLVGFSESAENVAQVASVIGAGFEYTPWLG